MTRRWPAMLAIVALACGSHQRRGATGGTDCRPAPDRFDRRADIAQLAGNWTITLVATEGPAAGRDASGRLELRPQAATLQAIASADTSVVASQPLVGRTDFPVEQVGGVRAGDPNAESATAPGVGVYITRLRNGDLGSIVARVGSASNTRGLTPIEGASFALFVERVSEGAMSGTWTSSPGIHETLAAPARGHFCASRIPG